MATAVKLQYACLVQRLGTSMLCNRRKVAGSDMPSVTFCHLRPSAICDLLPSIKQFHAPHRLSTVFAQQLVQMTLNT